MPDTLRLFMENHDLVWCGRKLWRDDRCIGEVRVIGEDDAVLPRVEYGLVDGPHFRPINGFTVEVGGDYRIDETKAELVHYFEKKWYKE